MTCAKGRSDSITFWKKARSFCLKLSLWFQKLLFNVLHLSSFLFHICFDVYILVMDLEHAPMVGRLKVHRRPKQSNNCNFKNTYHVYLKYFERFYTDRFNLNYTTSTYTYNDLIFNNSSWISCIYFTDQINYNQVDHTKFGSKRIWFYSSLHVIDVWKALWT